MAIVGDKRWEKWGTDISNPFFGAEMRFLEPVQRQQAERWLRESSRSAGKE